MEKYLFAFITHHCTVKILPGSVLLGVCVVLKYRPIVLQLVLLPHIPEKNCTISSLLQPNGSPLRRTKPSLAVSGLLGPVCFRTQSISTLFDLKTVKGT